MASVLQAGRANKGLSPVLRAWWALRCQKRRRTGRVQALPLPTLQSGLAIWEGTSGGFWDVSFGWVVDLGNYPAAGGYVAIEYNIDGQGGGLIGNYPVTDGSFYAAAVTEDTGVRANYRVRYWYNPGTGPVYGEWTPWLGVKCFFPPVPALSLVGQVWDQTVPGYSDVTLGWTFDHADLPAGVFDVQAAPGPNGTDWEDIGTVGSSERSFYHECAYTGQNGLTYRVRYRNDGVLGEWSAGFNVDFDD